MRHHLKSGVALGALLLSCGAALGQNLLPNIEIVGNTPVAGAGVPRDKIPNVTHVIPAEDVRINGTAEVLGALEARVGGVTLSNSQGNPFQPSLMYRGFEASPLAGNPQGLAVYVNGARFNAAVGDTMNWVTKRLAKMRPTAHPLPP